LEVNVENSQKDTFFSNYTTRNRNATTEMIKWSIISNGTEVAFPRNIAQLEQKEIKKDKTHNFYKNTEQVVLQFTTVDI
jgi:hypothetical protein